MPGESTGAIGASSNEREDADFILKVSRANRTPPPEPPPSVKAWLESGWDDPSQEATVRKSKTEQDSKDGTILVAFQEDRDRVTSFEIWKLKRDEWAKNEKPARAVLRVFESLYELYGRTEREAERVELVLGDGILSWRRAEAGIGAFGNSVL